jgi:dolichol-phosphate mannosyltransferase
MGAHNAYEVTGPLVAPLLALTGAAVPLAGLLLLALAVRTVLADAPRRRAALPWFAVAAVLAVVVTSKVLSPQYLLWVLPVAAAAWTAVPEAYAAPARRWTAGLLVATAATQVVFPLLYGTLVRGDQGALVVALTLAVRNALLVALLVAAVGQVLRATAPASTPPASTLPAPAVPSPRRTDRHRLTTSRTLRTVVVLPTYDEADNLERIVGRVRAAQPDVHVLVVDDASPDGTGLLAEVIAERDDHVHVLHGEGKGGLGRAYLRGFDWALRHGFEVVGEMDADGSHPPEQLGRLRAAIDAGADVVLGSRWVPGGTVEGWPWQRRLLSVGGNLYARAALRIPLRDMTGGYRLYRADGLRRLRLAEVESTGYCFQVDLARRAWHAGLHVVEVPIGFVEREAGASKMSSAVALESLRRVTAWGWGERLRGEVPVVDAAPATVP